MHAHLAITACSARLLQSAMRAMFATPTTLWQSLMVQSLTMVSHVTQGTTVELVRVACLHAPLDTTTH